MSDTLIIEIRDSGGTIGGGGSRGGGGGGGGGERGGGGGSAFADDQSWMDLRAPENFPGLGFPAKMFNMTMDFWQKMQAASAHFDKRPLAIDDLKTKQKLGADFSAEASQAWSQEGGGAIAPLGSTGSRGLSSGQMMANAGSAISGLGSAAGSGSAGPGGAIMAALPGGPSMAGPAGAMMAAVGAGLEINEAVRKAVSDSLVTGVNAMGSVFRAAASMSMEPFSQAIDQAVSKIPVFGESLVALKNVITDTMAGFDQTGRRLAQYDPQIAQAQAMREVAQVLGDVRRAQAASSKMAQYIEARSRFEQAWQDFLASVGVRILPALTQIVELGTKILDKLPGTKPDDTPNTSIIDMFERIAHGPSLPIPFSPPPVGGVP